MEGRKTSVFENGLIWFGAGISIAEILTGASFASIGFGKGLAAILLGHLMGCTILFLAGLMGAKTGKSAMETVKISFGQKGSLLFSVLNILQLTGWTAIMIYDGALAADSIYATGHWVWCLVIGGLIVLWILIGIRNLRKVNIVSMAALFLLTILLSVVIFRSDAISAAEEGLTFGAAVELSVAMPLSWLPLISDYTRDARKPLKATLASALVYGLVSCWMYVIGMGAAIFTGESQIARILVKAGLGAAGLLIIVFSTVTTTFLDACSAGVSSESVSPRCPGKWFAVGTAVIGTVGAILFPMDDITNFLYFIGSVFAPMIAIQIADFFLLKNDRSAATASLSNLAVWLFGFVVYRGLMRVDIVVGNTLPDMVVTILACVALHKLGKYANRRKSAS